MTASITTYPHEVVRTRLQTLRLPRDPGSENNTPSAKKRVSLVRTIQKILKHEGWRGLYKGLSINLLRTVPNSAVTMLTFVVIPCIPLQAFSIAHVTPSFRYELLMRKLSAAS